MEVCLCDVIEIDFSIGYVSAGRYSQIMTFKPKDDEYDYLFKGIHKSYYHVRGATPRTRKEDYCMGLAQRGGVMDLTPLEYRKLGPASHIVLTIIKYFNDLSFGLRLGCG